MKMNNKMTVVSKFRREYLEINIIGFIAGFFLLCFFIYCSIDNGCIDYKNIIFWAACLVFICLIVYAFYFIFSSLKQLAIKDDGFEVKYILAKETKFFKYKDIDSLQQRHIQNRRGAGYADGYFEFDIQLKNGMIITVSGYQYENFNEIQYWIYHNWQNK